MWFEEVGEVVEMFRSSFPLSFLFFVPILILISPAPASAAQEFAVYRMQQYDLQGSSYGSRNSLINVEARSLDAKVVTRRCVLAKLKDLAVEKYREIVSQSAGGLLVLLPSNLAALPKEEQEHLLDLEQEMLQEETQVPVYFTPETEEVLNMYDEVASSANTDHARSAAEALFSSASASGFQIVVSGSQPKALNDFQVVNIQGKLTGHGIEEQLPTIAIVAHYDAFGIAPSLSFGGDSNGSGVVALLEIARLFSKLYMTSRSHARYNLLFLLSGGGKFNYQGTKRWIEDQLDTTESSLLTDVSYVLCLDGLASGDTLHLHVSKPPKEGSSGDKLLKNLEKVSSMLFPDMQMKMVHKKINLADDFLAWEHERFSIRRLPAFTLSHHSSNKPLIRHSIQDTREAVNQEILTRNVKVIAESLARHVFNLSSEGHHEVFTQGLKVESGLLSAWLNYLCSHSRAAQLLTKDSSVVSTLEQTMSRYLKDVRKLLIKADKRDPEFVFYDGAEYTMNAYSVKPAIFDLFLALGIAAYLGALYFITLNFSIVYSAFQKIMAPVKVKGH